MPAKQSFFQANQLLAQLVPRDVLLQARKLAERLEHDARFKAYLLRRFWIIFPAALLFVAANTACAVTAISFLDAQLTSQFGLPRSAGLILVAIVWIGAFLMQVYLLFAWLERRAARQGIFSDHGESDSTTKRPGFPGGLVVLFVGFPLGILFLCLPQEAALAVIAVALFVPIIYTLIDK